MMAWERSGKASLPYHSSRSGSSRSNPFIVYRGCNAVLFRSKVQSRASSPVGFLIEREVVTGLLFGSFWLRANDREPMIMNKRAGAVRPMANSSGQNTGESSNMRTTHLHFFKTYL